MGLIHTKITLAVILGLAISSCGGSGGGGSTPPSRNPETVFFIADLNTPGQFELFRTLDDRAEPVRINSPLAANGDVFDFKLSPDRQWIAFRAGAAVGTQIHLFAARVSGGNPTQLSAFANVLGNVQGFEWSPDNTRIVYEADSDIEGVTELFLVDRDGSDNHKINGNVSTTVETVNPQWSNDSRFVAYEVRLRQAGNQTGSTLDIVGVNTHDTMTGVVGGLPNSVRVSRPAITGRSVKTFQWSSRSNLIAYNGDFGATVGRDELYTATPGVTGSNTNNPRINTINAGFQGVKAFSWAPDGIRLAYNAFFSVPQRDVVTIIVDAGAASLDEIFANLPGAPTNSPIGIDQFWWSPDSNFVAFDADSIAANREELFVTSVTTRATTKVSTSPMSAGNRLIRGNVEWSGNSQYLAYRADTLSGRIELFSVRPDGSQHTTVSELINTTGQVNIMQWSPDSRSLTYHGDLENANIVELYVGARSGGGQVKISPAITSTATGRGVSGTPTWSCDNQRVVYTVRQAPTSLPELFSSRANTGALGGAGGIRLHTQLFGTQFVSEFSGCPVANKFGAD